MAFVTAGAQVAVGVDAWPWPASGERFLDGNDVVNVGRWLAADRAVVAELAERIAVELVGADARPVTTVATLRRWGPAALSEMLVAVAVAAIDSSTRTDAVAAAGLHIRAGNAGDVSRGVL